MNPRRLAIEWDELGTALTWHTDEGGHYLDVTNGEIVCFTGLDDELAEDEVDAGLQEGRLIPIEPLPASVEYGWMEAFVGSAVDGQLRRLLQVALSGKGAFRRFKDVLGGHPPERKRWFAFRRERVHAAARDWLEDHGIEAANQPRMRPLDRAGFTPPPAPRASPTTWGRGSRSRRG
jgi:hypothetical protein